MKLEPKIRMKTPDPLTGLCEVRSPYNKKLVAIMKQYPGARYAPEITKGVWLFPSELIGVLESEVKKARIGLGIDKPAVAPPDLISQSPEPSQQLYPYQQSAVRRILETGSQLIAFDTGIGKGAVAIDAMRLGWFCGAAALIVCPSSKVPEWIEEIPRFWADTPTLIEVVAKGGLRVARVGVEAEPETKAERLPSEMIIICSFGMVQKLETAASFSHIVIDEAHYLKNPKSDRSKLIRTILENNPRASKIFLTATPIADDPGDLWNILDLLYPGRFGEKPWKFMDRYSNKEIKRFEKNGEPQTRSRFFGANEINAQELAARLQRVAIRVTKEEAAPFLPAWQVKSLFVEPSKHADWNPNVTRLDPRYWQEFQLATSDTKIKTAIQLVQDALEIVPRVAVITDLRSTAKLFAERLLKQAPEIQSFVVTGESTVKKRQKLIAEATAASQSCLIGTMGSIGTGINTLTVFQEAFMIELNYYPVITVQALGRFSRLNSKLPSTVTILITKDSPEETKAQEVLAKVEAANLIMKSGAGEQALREALNTDKQTAKKLAKLGLGSDDQPLTLQFSEYD